MSRKSSAEILLAAGVDVVQHKNLPSILKQNVQTFEIPAYSIPPYIIDRIKQEPLLDKFDVTDKKPYGKEILRCKKMVFHPRGEFLWALPKSSNLGNFVAIAVDNLVLNTPNHISELSKLILRPPYTTSDLKGTVGKPGKPGRESGHDDGTNGGNGEPGGRGGNGQTYNYPTVLIFFREVTVNIADPSITSAMRIEGVGVKGGDGGRGGRGGDGGRGMRGTPGDRDCVLGVCVCSAGPGRGGNGGAGGSGGQGGNAGLGGNGATIIFVGPAADQSKLDHLEISILGAFAGQPGQPGDPGIGGSEGGGGSKPFECVEGGGSGTPGGPANPANLGQGNKKPNGVDGSIFTTIRDNTDLF